MASASAVDGMVGSQRDSSSAIMRPPNQSPRRASRLPVETTLLTSAAPQPLDRVVAG